MLCCTLLYVYSSFVIILIGKRELVAFLGLSYWYIVIAVLLFLVVPWVCLWFVIMVFPGQTHLLFFVCFIYMQSQNVKSTSVLINMKRVSHIR